MVSNFIDIFAMHVADHIQVWGVDDHLASGCNRWLEFVHGFGSGP